MGHTRIPFSCVLKDKEQRNVNKQSVLTLTVWQITGEINCLFSFYIQSIKGYPIKLSGGYKAQVQCNKILKYPWGLWTFSDMSADVTCKLQKNF